MQNRSSVLQIRRAIPRLFSRHSPNATSMGQPTSAKLPKCFESAWLVPVPNSGVGQNPKLISKAQDSKPKPNSEIKSYQGQGSLPNKLKARYQTNSLKCQRAIEPYMHFPPASQERARHRVTFDLWEWPKRNPFGAPGPILEVRKKGVPFSIAIHWAP